MRIDVVTIFPDYLEPLRQSLPGKAIDTGIVELGVQVWLGARQIHVGRAIGTEREPTDCRGQD